ncbi:MAG: MFS transporter [Planctomycetes bacterium]|jgi:MFS family permease|nr:MFS transporter [Planctomycetota bacterium]MBT4027842.1 MFS transporter [Planctomycetota bacterium]MBT7318542.1 MFS transporter [Planctomycetota bacterium]
MTDVCEPAPASNDENVSAVKKYFQDFKVLKETKREYWGLQLVNILDCLAYFAMFNIATVTLSQDFGFSDEMAGWIYALFSGLTTIFLFFSGVFTDWLGIKKALIVAMLGLVLCRAGVVVAEQLDEPIRLNETHAVAELFDGRGLGAIEGSNDLIITGHNDVTFEVDLYGAATIGDVLQRIDSASGNDGAIRASIAPGWVSLRLEDTIQGDSYGGIKVTGTASNPDMAKRLGLQDAQDGDGPLDGKRLVSDLNGVLVAKLNQGDGLSGGDSIHITDGWGNEGTISGLSKMVYVSDLRQHIEDSAKSAGLKVNVNLNVPGNGLMISNHAKQLGEELSGLSIDGDAADALGILRTGDDATNDLVAGENIKENKFRSWLVIGLLALMAPFMAMLQTVFQAGNKRFTTKRSRGAGFNLWYLFMNVGAAGGGFLIDILYIKMDLPLYHVFTFGLVTGILSLVSIMLFIRNTDQLLTPEEEAELAAAPPAEEKEKLSPFQIAKAVLSEKAFWRFTTLITLLLGVRAVFLYLGLLFPKFWYRVIGPEAKVGLMQAFNPVLVIIGLIVVIPLLQKFNVYKMLVFGALITSISMFIPAIPFTASLGLSISDFTYITTGLFLLVLTVGELIWSPRLSEYTAAIAPEGQEGTYLGLTMVPYFLAKLIISAYSGTLLARYCAESAPGEPNVGERIAAGNVAFTDSPYFMWAILGTVALVGTLAAIFGKSWFTQGASFDKEDEAQTA